MAETFTLFKNVAFNQKLKQSFLFSSVCSQKASTHSSSFSSYSSSSACVPFCSSRRARHASVVWTPLSRRLPCSRKFLCVTRAQAASSSGSIEESIQSKITSSVVVVYSKTWCPYCQEVKQLFKELGVKTDIVELDELDVDEMQFQDGLKALTGQSTVPNVFIGGKHIGGCSETMELYQNGELTRLLSAAGINLPS